MNKITEDFFFPLDYFKYEVSENDVNRFKEAALDYSKPNEFILESQDGMFKIIQDEKIFMIVMRKYNYTLLEEIEESIEEIDYSIMMIYKIAMKSGFKVFLEQKYSN